ncbi:MAG TPA: VWA domain-containing protein [Pseudomonadales bacterium]|nr:VWA domain-containing protein [Pseudomonadales bacterium]MDP6317095.1 VWA domain-containing protein [Pseudomonadales bacterium]MDP7316152.1 VWA domain-containing protein [Pseudomonadales bacterium]HJP50827.1 VWA domain-containing protein [Pseudomonadales bacterium]
MNPVLTDAIVENFHFLRPEWFYAVIPALILVIILGLRQGRGSNWEQTIDPRLLPYLIDDPGGKPGRNPMYLILIAWILAIVALAGPVWQKTPQPVHEREDAIVILFDLTRSMYATDVKPNRLVRAQRKLLDLLAARAEGVTALVVYSGDAHLVSPLTDDAKTIAEMIPAISPEIMPAPGSELTPALKMAKTLFDDAGIKSGRIVIVTDEIRDAAEAQRVARQFRFAFPVSVLAVGTEDGAPIPGTRSNVYLKDQNGTLIIPRVDFAALRDFAGVAGGRFTRMTLIDDDLAYLLADEPLIDQEQFRELERDFDVWFEQGPWLLLLLLPLAAISFRRGWIWSLVLVCLLPTPEAEASLWDDLWETRDQQASKAMQQGDAKTAADLFKNEQWKGAAQYRGEDFVAAARAFASSESDDGKYNLGNALARQGQLEEAIIAYDEALALNPENEDAGFNKQLVETLLEQQQQEQQQQEGNDEQNQNPEDSEENEQGDQNQDSEDQQQSDEQKEGEEQESEDSEQQEQEQQEGEEQQASESEPEPLDEEEQQALQQWLRRVPDDPGGLLRRKFMMQYNERLKRGIKTPHDSSNW